MGDESRTLQFNFVSLFPEVIIPYMESGVVGRAIQRELICIEAVNFRDFAEGNYRSVDDVPFGGGPGVVIQAEPVALAIDSLQNVGKKIMLSPNGKPFTQQDAQRLSQESAITFICGRYEGIDARLQIEYVDEVFSVGDYVLSGGELPALMIADAITRLIPGVLNNADSSLFESHCDEMDFLLEHPHYTRPALWRGHTVPDVLLSGHHARIEAWRRDASLKLTAQVRPDLFKKISLNPKDRARIQQLLKEDELL